MGNEWFDIGGLLSGGKPSASKSRGFVLPFSLLPSTARDPRCESHDMRSDRFEQRMSPASHFVRRCSRRSRAGSDRVSLS
jgi:hypothetical protein